MAEGDARFTGSIAQLYHEHLVPLIFRPYAEDLRRRLAPRNPARILEVAAGTGVATRELASLPDANIVATDLNPAMLEEAAARGTPRNVVWRQADALALPFGDAAFDAVVCQFGAMFFPDRPKAFAEARRVLRPGGIFLFSTWDGIRHNEFADVVTVAMAQRYPRDPPRFLARTPYGYHDEAAIRRDIAGAGYAQHPQIDTLAARSRAASPRIPAVAFCQGTPLRNEILERDPDGLEQATEAATAALAHRFGTSAVDGKIQAKVVQAFA